MSQVDPEFQRLISANWDAHQSGDQALIRQTAKDAAVFAGSRPTAALSDEERAARKAEARRQEEEAMKDIPVANPDALETGIQVPTPEAGSALARLQEFFAQTFGFTEFGMQVTPSDPFLRDVLVVCHQLDKAAIGLAMVVHPDTPETTPAEGGRLSGRQQAQGALDDIDGLDDTTSRRYQ